MLLHFERQRELVLDNQDAAARRPVDRSGVSVRWEDLSGAGFGIQI
jgi:hypothetical protein